MEKVSLWGIFTAFLKIGAFTIGGGYVMVPAIQEEMSSRGWISDEELPDIVALAQAAPGLLTVNMSVFAGYKLRGVAGSIIATLGVILCPIIVILLIALFFSSIRDNVYVEKIFMGVRPAAVGVITAYTVKLFSKNSRWWQWAVAIAALCGISFLQISPIYIILVVLTAAFFIALYRERRAE
ncbi:MAG: chromate transporter [Bacteroidales bacterium]|nr:chromate transporter [Candidatus Cryptobacteroides equifaecalis]